MQHGLEHVGHDRLADVIVHAGVEAALAIVGKRVRGHGHDAQAAAVLALARADGARGLEAVYPRPSSQFVYHGSSTPMLTTLEPRKQSIPREVERAAWPELVYASDLPAFAAAHAFSWGTNEGFQLLVSADGRVTMLVPSQHRHRMQRPVYLYTAYAGSFVSTSEEHSGHTFHSSEPVAVLSCAAFASVEEAIEHHGGDVSYVGSS